MKHQDLIDKMTLAEKAAFLSGKSEWESRDYKRLGIPSIFCSDGPHGIRKQAGAGDHLGLNASLPSTCFPTAATVANSWDEALGQEIGDALGEEAEALGVNVLLGPGLNIKRSPLCGRNFEYFSEDPYLAGKMAASYIRGIQGHGVYACPKHFAVNSQELRRMSMNSVLDERTLREIYLTGFEIAVKEGGAKAIMSSYNEVNGTYANENTHLLKDILRGEWGFDGIVITDWGGSNSHTKGVAAGSNLEMPNPGLDSAREILSSVKNGTLKMEELDACVDDLLDAVLTLSKNAENRKKSFSETAHHELARKAAAESAVLLKNEEQILPLAVGSKVAVIGDFAFLPRYQGAGSSVVNATFVETTVRMIENYDLKVVGSCHGYKRTGEEHAGLKKEALELAGQADIVLFCMGLDELSESEGLDRIHMRIPRNQIDLLEAMAQVNPNIVAVVSAGAAIEMPWQHCCKAILHGYLSGQAGAGAMLDILTGRVNPSGHLSETYPVKYGDTPAYEYFPSAERNSEYREGLFVGYRYYDTGKIQVQYPFGYGLSYTTFEYSDLKTDEWGVSFTLTNTGSCDGAEVAQLYVSLPDAEVFRPEKELKGFKKVFLKAGESREVTIKFDDKTFRYWNVLTDQWETEGGNYRIMVGASVVDIRLEAEVKVEGTTKFFPYKKEELPSYYSGQVQKVEDNEFEALLGHPIPDGKWSGELGVNDSICQMYYAKSSLARLIYKILTSKKKKSEAKGKPDLNILFIYNMPFRSIAKMTNGMVSMEMVHGMVEVVNGHFFRGMKKVIGGFFANRKANQEYEARLAGK
ncbi:MAG: glycoside hydrolase family 3 C-terminal domain-containing protein [Faecalicatena sp.]|uniref:glycoside hydrolase family 3 C-terminal domain-containing protein n=1 Tax=Faecalicatena sp. TaxID=2005360 RepID=UPI00258C9454|nr:glycoside hydrolase family 3 C-terminal domain-containing protein [Faecalicatena sp.]MCI6465515.1 glycoside hydrolase family 3 C-terminal domain-containing protein [Faecalicatena sp.]MDY5617347.1 glycoside hydrolase family 3 C-terminal domain-containing protein [Lachnospiraceae bacterium]